MVGLGTLYREFPASFSHMGWSLQTVRTHGTIALSGIMTLSTLPEAGPCKHISQQRITDWSISSVQFSCSVMSDSLWPHELQHARTPCPSPTPGVHINPCPLSQCDAIQQYHPLLSLSPPALNLSQHQGLFKWVSTSHQVAKVLEFQLQHQSFQWTPRTDLL